MTWPAGIVLVWINHRYYAEKSCGFTATANLSSGQMLCKALTSLATVIFGCFLVFAMGPARLLELIGYFIQTFEAALGVIF
jgi:hypothetical protein